MSWIVIGEEKGKIKLVSKTEVDGILPKGSFLTVEDRNMKYILRVDDSKQHEPYSPSPMIIDMDLEGLYADQKCQNIIYAYRIKDLTNREDGLIDYIRPQLKARRSSQDEIDIALGNQDKGAKVFLATIHGGQNQLLIDNNKNFVTANLPDDMFFHQMLICGKTGSGKTVATKYLAQYFIEELEGAVLAINVKDIDFLRMEKPSETNNPNTLKEWEVLGKEPKGIQNYKIYYPGSISLNSVRSVNFNYCEKITLDVHTIEPEALTGLLHNISDIGAQSFPNIFRYWQNRVMNNNSTFNEFIRYFIRIGSGDREFKTLNIRGDENFIILHKGTFENILRNLDIAVEFFDNEDARIIDETDILQHGKLSVINVAGTKGIQFGSVVLRHLLRLIVQKKSDQKSDVPILIIIDEVHQFYNTESSKEALGDLDTICRTGRSQKIGVIFSSQNPSDIPRELSSVINTKIFLKPDSISTRDYGISLYEMETLKKGFAVTNIHDMSLLKVIKFPLSYAGVFDK
ncbi:ATP-binding protein [Candidatus Dependentiae bacterium]|nr:ATP-binding protein [Candidatus Dependentiae bacterium]